MVRPVVVRATPRGQRVHESPFARSTWIIHEATNDATPAFAMLEWLRPVKPKKVADLVVSAAKVPVPWALGIVTSVSFPRGVEVGTSVRMAIFPSEPNRYSTVTVAELRRNRISPASR